MVTLDETKMAEEGIPVRVKLKIGDVETEIECTENQLKSVVELMLLTLQKRMKPPVSVRFPTSKRKTCKAVIKDLWSEGWFSLPRTLGEVCEEISVRGFHFDRSAVSHVLCDLIRERYLMRIGKPRIYEYLQKRPPSSE